MTQTPHSSSGEAPGDPGQQGREDTLDRMREQLMAISAGDVVAEAAVPLLTLAYARLGLPPEEHARYRDLPAARLLIDALGGMLDGVQGRLGQVEGQLRDALAQVRMAYVEVERHSAGEHGPDGRAAGETPAGAGDDRAGEPLSRPSGLWVPGQPL